MHLMGVLDKEEAEELSMMSELNDVAKYYCSSVHGGGPHCGRSR